MKNVETKHDVEGCSNKKEEDVVISRRSFLGKSGKIIVLGALANFTLLGKANAGDYDKKIEDTLKRDPCNGNLEYVPGLDKCGVQGTPDEPGCGWPYYACYLFAGHRPE